MTNAGTFLEVAEVIDLSSRSYILIERMMTVNFVIRKADRGDLKDILTLTYAKPPVIDRALVDRFDDILSQTGYSLLAAFMNGRLAGLLSVCVTDGIGRQFPFAVTDSGIIGGEFQGFGIEDALIARAQYIAAENGCKSIRSK